jgi:hypothetical protein
MKESKMMIVHKVLAVMNVGMCLGVACAGVFEKNALAACGWLAAALAYVQVNQLRMFCEQWKDLGSKATDIFHALFGNGGQIVGIEVKRVEKNTEEQGKTEKKELPDFAPKAAESFHECAKEFFRYIEDGNREFSVSHGGITVSVSIPEDAPAASEEVSGDK